MRFRADELQHTATEFSHCHSYSERCWQYHLRAPLPGSTPIGTHTALMIEDNLSLCPKYDSRRYLSGPPAALLSSRLDTAGSCISQARPWFGGLSCRSRWRTRLLGPNDGSATGQNLLRKAGAPASDLLLMAELIMCEKPPCCGGTVVILQCFRSLQDRGARVSGGIRMSKGVWDWSRLHV